MTRAPLGLALVLAVVGVPVGASRAEPAPGPAQEAYQRGLIGYREGNFAAAAAAFRQAYELDPQVDYLFGWAQAVRVGGDCAGALPLYDKLLGRQLTPEQRDATAQAMARCRRLAASPSTGPAPPVSTPAAGDPRAPVDDPWYRDGLGHALVGGGVVVLGLGAGFTWSSVTDERAAERADLYGEHERLTDRARLRRAVGVTGLGLGAALVAWGVYRYATHGIGRGRGPEGAAVTAWLDGDGGGVVLAAPF